MDLLVPLPQPPNYWDYRPVTCKLNLHLRGIISLLLYLSLSYPNFLTYPKGNFLKTVFGDCAVVVTQNKTDMNTF